MTRRILNLLAVCALAGVAYACDTAKPNPAAPTPTENAGPSGTTLKASAPTVQTPVNDTKMTSETVVLTAGGATLQFQSETPVTLQYRFQVFNSAGTMVEDALVSGTTRTVAAALVDGVRHTWRVRAETQGEAGPWSSTASFLTRDPSLVLDPLTNGRTVGRQIGGVFIPGVGWQSQHPSNGIDYNIPTCDNCTIEFDITNIGKGEGVCCGNDLKFLSMGHAPDFSDFQSFRDHDWKMHMIQRADGDGTGLEMIWRNGDGGEGNPGDHRVKMTCCGPDWRDSSVFHFVVRWTPAGYHVSVGTNGGPQVPYMEDGFGGVGYNPPNHRVQLGCVPRGEGFPSAIYRNVRIYRNP
jgi:hypothetical protein